MQESIVYGYTLPDAYHRAIRTLHRCGSRAPCPDYGTEQQELSMTMVVQHPTREPMISRLFPGGPRELEQYRQEILDGILDFEIERGNWAYTYHDRIATQIPFVINELKRDPSSRRAVITARTEADLGSSAPACLQHIQYFIRGSKLHCKVLMRSNDAVKATFMNAFAFIMLQQRIANELGCDVGTYTHRANSFHCYKKDLPLLAAYYRRSITAPDECTYNYAGQWQELMESARPEIAAMVKELKERG